METAKVRRSSVNSRGSDVTASEEKESGLQAWDGERERETDRESDTVDGLPSGAELPNGHRGSAERQKASTLGYQKKQWQKGDFATLGKAPSGSTKHRAGLMQVFFSQGASDKTPTQEDQGEALKQALQSFAVPADLTWRWGEKEGALESSWTDLVHSHTTMSKAQRHQQEALWELVHTELSYINKLTIVTDLVLAALANVHQKGLLQEVTPELLFSNLPSILSAHRLFWQEVMYPMLQEVRQTGRPFDPLKLDPGFFQLEERFSPYLEYCWEEERNVEFTRKQLESNPNFSIYLMWVETHPQCGRMRLGDMQAKPHQRITKYPLLLKAVLKNTQDSHTRQTLQRMLANVNEFLDTINNHLQLKKDEMALADTAQRIEEQQVEGMSEEIEKHVREFCRFDLTSPMRGVGPGVVRKLLLEENIKVKGKKDSKLEVAALLFSDVLLVTKSQRKTEKLKMLRPPMAVERLRCAELKDGLSFVLVEVSDLGCAVNVCSMTTPSPESCATWISTIREAQETLEALRKKTTGETVAVSPADLEGSETPPTEVKRANEEAEQVSETVAPPLSAVQSYEQPVDRQLENRNSSHKPVERQETLVQTRQAESADTHGKTTSEVRRDSLAEGGTPEAEESAYVGEYMNMEGEYVYFKSRERRVTWKHTPQASVNHGNTNSDPSESNRPGVPRPSSQGVFPEADAEPPRVSSVANRSVPPAERRLSPSQINGLSASGGATGFDTDDESEVQGSRRASNAEIETGKFARKLENRFRRKRPVNAQPNSQTEGTRGGGSTPSGSQDGHRVLKLGALKLNQGVFWNMPTDGRSSPGPRSDSDNGPAEKPTDDRKPEGKPKLKAQRSASIPELVYQGSQSPPLSHNRKCFSPVHGLHLPENPSPIRDILRRAKERQEGRKEEKKKKKKKAERAGSPAASSQSASEGEKEAEVDEKPVMHGWKEGNVDWSEDENKGSPFFPDGASVDWPGWCFDDQEILGNLVLDDLEETLTAKTLRVTDRQEDENSEYEI